MVFAFPWPHISCTQNPTTTTTRKPKELKQKRPNKMWNRTDQTKEKPKQSQTKAKRDDFLCESCRTELERLRLRPWKQRVDLMEKTQGQSLDAKNHGCSNVVYLKQINKLSLFKNLEIIRSLEVVTCLHTFFSFQLVFIEAWNIPSVWWNNQYQGNTGDVLDRCLLNLRYCL